MSSISQSIRFELLMDAGFGAQKAGDILIRACAQAGHHVFFEPVIPAEISPPPRSRPALSGAIIRISTDDINCIGDGTDLMLAAHEVLLDTRLDDGEFNPGCRVLLDSWYRRRQADAYDAAVERARAAGCELVEFLLPTEAEAIIRELKGAGRNMFYLGMLASLYVLAADSVERFIRQAFSRLSEPALARNCQLFQMGLAFAAAELRTTALWQPEGPSDEPQILIDGNSALSMGCIDAGIRYLSGYPITPASSILHTLARELPHYGGMVHQAEDEIAAIGSAIGAYYGGTPAVTCTSGPGFSLKQEFIGFASIAEIPIIVVDAQRAGPSTGMPTKTEQSDLPAAVFGRHGDNTVVVLSVADVEDCFYAPHVARYIAEKLRLPVIILSDFQTANSFKVVAQMSLAAMTKVDEISDDILARFQLRRLVEPIAMVKDKQAIPGTAEGAHRVTGLNTNAAGDIDYDPQCNHRAHRLRNEKLHVLSEHSEVPTLWGEPNAEQLIVGWGSTQGALREAVDLAAAQGHALAALSLKLVHPLPRNIVEALARFRKVGTVEAAYGDPQKPAPLATLLRIACERPVASLLSPASGRPLRPQQILDAVLKAES